MVKWSLMALTSLKGGPQVVNNNNNPIYTVHKALASEALAAGQSCKGGATVLKVGGWGEEIF